MWVLGRVVLVWFFTFTYIKPNLKVTFTAANHKLTGSSKNCHSCFLKKNHQFAIKWSRWIQNILQVYSGVWTYYIVWCFSSGQPRLRCDVRLKIGGNQDHWDRPSEPSWLCQAGLCRAQLLQLNPELMESTAFGESSVSRSATLISNQLRSWPRVFWEWNRIGLDDQKYISCKKLSMNSTCTGPLWWFICIFKTILIIVILLKTQKHQFGRWGCLHPNSSVHRMIDSVTQTRGRYHMSRRCFKAN